MLAKRTLEYREWVEGYARNHKIPIVKAEKGDLTRSVLHHYLIRRQVLEFVLHPHRDGMLALGGVNRQVVVQLQ